MEHRSSIAIYQRATETGDDTRPITPDEVFEAAKEVTATKGMKLIQNRTGVFVVIYSETGPFNEKQLGRDWLPVQVYVMKQWASGGIKKSEMQAYDENKNEIDGSASGKHS